MFEEEELNVKVLKSLNRTWQLKVTSILESKDLTSIIDTELFGKLKEYEIGMTMMVGEQAKERKSKGLTLASAIPLMEACLWGFYGGWIFEL